ncbi:rust resistance kinase Lr10 isoform X2 [Ziziphus jujuba]|uniref:Rust resistance kinase Lr10 isoform X2 n=1 Tax=Ziziphus jujuba TaxID=326968 RepID=A0A6P3ZFU1_ZIZJJ|nr:rust resistance kinase Lr10 isoform X2 [Ziziphus jujuba]
MAMDFSWFCMLVLVLVAFFIDYGGAQNQCKELRCGHNSPPIRFPFRVKDQQPNYCGYPGFDLSCSDKHETVLELPTPAKFSVRKIDYESQEIEVYDPYNCLLGKLLKNLDLTNSPFHVPKDIPSDYTLFNCSTLDRKNLDGLVPCLSGSAYQIYMVDSYTSIEYLPLVYCTKMYNASNVPFSIYRSSYDNLLLKWYEPNCGPCEAKGNQCGLKKNGTKLETECLDLKKSKGATLGAFVLSLLVIVAYRVYSFNKLEKENQVRIERFLEDYKALKPSRYSYADIKRITNQFKDKLGQGAYGTVFKGKLTADFFVAVKILNNSKGNGEEFINEVGTMGRIHHVNVVRLVGFCADGFRRALVYEFLPSGSLQKYISLPDSNSFLGWGKLQEIAFGIAKGIEYLHQGCDQRILHFDIKPHNVLLDNNFTPKISDFGLAKLCAKDQSTVSMTTARGTMGYIAPEVFSRNFGSVSYKSDVYSFGILLLEMVGGRKNTDVTADNISEIYYPEWIYNLLEEGEDLRIHIEKEEDAKIAKRLAIVGLWCIQWHPVDRPSMKLVVQMLESGESLIMPPNPFGSTGQTKSNASKPARRMNLELETIAEVE